MCDFQFRMAREHVEAVVTMQDGRLGTNGDGPNKTIDRLANGFPFPAKEAIGRAALDAIRWKERKGWLRSEVQLGSYDFVRPVAFPLSSP